MINIYCFWEKKNRIFFQTVVAIMLIPTAVIYFDIVVKVPSVIKQMAHLKTEVIRNQIMSNFPKNKCFLPPDTHT